MKKNTPLLLIFLVVFINLLGFGLLIPILPTFAVKELNLSETSIGIVISIYSLVQFLLTPFFGTLSDKYGRRKIILLTLFLNVIGYIIFAFSNSFFLLLISRIISGIGGSSIGVAQAYIADVTTKEERTRGMGLIGVAFGLGFVFGPVIGGILSQFGYMLTGFVSASFSFLAFLFSIFLLPESLKRESSEEVIQRKLFDLKNLLLVFKMPITNSLIIIFFVVTFSNANIFGTLPLLGYSIYKLTDLQIGYIFGINGIIGAFVQGFLLHRLSKKYKEEQLIIFGSFFMMLGLSLLPFGGNVWGLIFLGIIFSFGMGVLQPLLISMVSKYTSSKNQGIVLGVNQSLSALGRMLGPLWGGFSYQYFGYQLPFLTGGFFTFIIWIYSIFFLRKKLKNVFGTIK